MFPFMKMPEPNHRPALTDRPALLRQRDRAIGQGLVDVLHRLAADEIQDRLSEINRRFTAPALVTGFPDLWGQAFPDARVIRDDPVLDLQPGAHDLVIHAMALHWADDPVGQIAQCARALREDGLFIAVCFGGQTLHELRGALAQAVADLLPQKASYRDLIHLAHDLRAMGEGNAMAARLRRPTGRAVFARAAVILAEHHADRDDPSRIAVTFDLVFLTGWSPSDTQPKPLRRGSATTRLEDALKEIRTKT